MDYQMPRAANVPSFKLGFTCTPCPSNPLGMKGCGEAGAIGSPPAVINAVTDALWHLGVRDVAMPLSPYTVWKTLQSARA
jgi:carbon-monoxide dehydrogenase large subunit